MVSRTTKVPELDSDFYPEFDLIANFQDTLYALVSGLKSNYFDLELFRFDNGSNLTHEFLHDNFQKKSLIKFS